ncbi:hypothetical protein C8J57DRAFT_1534843 [Mycena rebaudengoi]|nr:hypothetical protein C8J57DRAFT_1534843 [Mycena rebaudengoi]
MSSTSQPSFVLSSADIYGGSFYNVSGNVNQVFNSQASRNQRSTSSEAQAAQSSLVIRSHKGPRQSVSWPYPTASSNQCYTLGPETDGGATSSQYHFPPEQAVFYGVVRDDHNDSLQRLDVPQHSHSENVGSATGHVESNAYSIGGDMTQIKITSFGESGLSSVAPSLDDASLKILAGIDILYRHIVMEALHNSGERFPDPICHPGTRTKILQDLAFWSLDNAVEPMLWLHGLAGVGKSAIAQMFSVNCDNQGHLGASFFFKRGHPRRGTWDGLITTIAYQLARAVPEFSFPLQQAIEDDKLVVGRSISIQFDRLLVQPFRHLRELPLRPIVILDGLDECADHNHQQKILQLFIQAFQTGQLPFRLLVASRPEPYLREVLEGDAMSKLCRPLVLGAEESAYQDVRVFFQDEFSRIRSKFAKRGVDLGEEVWPATNIIDRLVYKSSGIFIYATTVIRFVEDEYSHPADRLTSLLSLDPSSTTPLDDLYTQILSRLTHGPDELRILHAVILPGGLYWSYPEDVDIILGLRPGRSRLMLRGLQALLSVPEHQTPEIFRSSLGVGTSHTTFSDYLHDPRRSGNWCIEIPWLHRDMLESIIRFLSNPDFTNCITLRR